MRLRVTLLLCSLCSAACKERVDATSGPAPTASAAAGGTATTAPTAPDFSPWDFAAIRAEFKGGLVFRAMGTWVAWEMHGDRGVIFDDLHGKSGEDTAVTFELEAPCRARVKYGDEKTGSASSNFEFTLKDGVFPGGSGGVGMKKGDEYVFCEGTDVVYRFGAAGCAAWTIDHATWSRRKDATCGVKDHEGKLFFFTNLVSAADYRITIDGDVLHPAFVDPTAPIKAKDLADAKMKAAALQK